jgi:hypothetical protein
MREQICDVIGVLCAHGDENLNYVDGSELLGSAFAHRMPDLLHPDADGYRILAERYAQNVMPILGLGLQPSFPDVSAR